MTWIDEVQQGRLVDVIERRGRFSRTGVAFRAWDTEDGVTVRVQVRTARETDSYEVMDDAGNWEADR